MRYTVRAMRVTKINGIEAAVARLKEDPDHPVTAEIDGLVIEMRYKGLRTAAEGQALLEAINRACADDSPDPEEVVRRQAMQAKQRRLVEGEW